MSRRKGTILKYENMEETESRNGKPRNKKRKKENLDNHERWELDRPYKGKAPEMN